MDTTYNIDMLRLLEASQAIKAILFALFCAALVGGLASKRGYSTLTWFFVSFLTMPALTICAVAALPDRGMLARRQLLYEAIRKGEQSFARAMKTDSSTSSRECR